MSHPQGDFQCPQLEYPALRGRHRRSEVKHLATWPPGASGVRFGSGHGYLETLVAGGFVRILPHDSSLSRPSGEKSIGGKFP